MKALFMKHKWMEIVYGALLVVAGILAVLVVLNNENEEISKWLSIVLAVTLFTYSITVLLTGFLTMNKRIFDITFLYAVAFIAVGVCLLIKTDLLGQFLLVFLATCLIGMAVVLVLQGVVVIVLKLKDGLLAPILIFILAAILLTGGILSFVFEQDVTRGVYMGLGGLIILLGVIEMIKGIILITRKEDKEKKVVDAPVAEKKEKLEYKDADVIDVEPKKIETKDE